MFLTPLRTHRRTTALAAFLNVVALVVLGVAPVQALPAQTEDPPPQVLLLMDASGSMKEPDPSGSSKMDAAKAALDGVIQDLPESSQVGLRVYGATEAGGEPTPAACADTQLVAPIAELDQQKLSTAVDGFQAKGETPIAHSLEQATTDFTGDGAKRIILVSDGEESCVPDPCPQVESLAEQDIDLTIDIVGLAVDGATKDQLSCLTEATDGTYYDAADAGELADGLQVLTQRAVRDFTFSGIPTQGAEQPDSATLIEPGSHTTTLAPDESPTFFRVDRRDRTLHFTVTVAPPKNTGGWTDTLTISASLPDGGDCGSKSTPQLSVGGTRNQIYSTQYTIDTVDLGQFSAASPECLTADELVLSVVRDSDSGVDADAMISVDLERPVTHLETLPPKIADTELSAVPPANPQGDASSIVGGLSFKDAPEVGPGRYVIEMGLDESAVVAVPTDWGQQVSATARVSNPDHELYLSVEGFGPNLGPAGQSVGSSKSAASTIVRRGTVGRFDFGLPPVRYLNRASALQDAVANASRAGSYYLVVVAQPTPADEAQPGDLVTVELDVARTGEAGTGPDYATTALDRSTKQDASTATAAPPAQDSSTATGADNTQQSDSIEAGAAPADHAGTSAYLGWLAGGSAVVLLATGAALWGLLRKRT